MRRLLLALCAGGLCSGAFAQVVPSGTTATSVTTGPAGQALVGIAPVGANATSINQYSAFSVSPAGVQLNNRTVGASTIVNEVTSARRSFINGPVEVLGSRAHLIVVNPNGITVDGASFTNVGGVALGAGSIRYAGGNAVLSTGNGDVEIGPGGLSGTMTSLQLIAGRLKIDGPVTNNSASPNADIALTAANHEVTLDGSLSPSSTLRPWASRRDLGGSSNEILIDVTPRGSLSASRIQIAVSSRGAGVSFAGTGQASIGEFSISSNGRVGITGGRLQAEKAMKIVAPSIEILNSPATEAVVQSLSGAVTLLANAGDIDLRGYVTGAQRDGADPDSKGAVTLAASGDIRLLSESADRLAIAFASAGDLSVTAGGAVSNKTGRLLSNANAIIESASLSNSVDVVGASAGGQPRLITVRRKTMGWPIFGSKKTRVYGVDYGELRVPGQLAYIVGQSVQIRTGEFLNSGEINAQDGSMAITASSIVNQGGRTGTFLYSKSCWIVCRSNGESSISGSGGAINSAFGMQLTASGSIVNDAGQIVAYGNMELNAPRIVGTAGYVPAIARRPGGLRTLFAGYQSWIAFTPSGGTYIAPIGSISVNSASPVELNGGDLLAGTELINPAGVARGAGPLPPATLRRDHIGLLRSWFD